MTPVSQDRIGEGGFTPGPWSLGDRSTDQCWQAVNGPGWAMLARVVVRLTGEPHDEPTAVANAHLIAAAPDNYRCNQQSTDMLEAMLAEDWLPESVKAEIAVQIEFNRAALAKARGK